MFVQSYTQTKSMSCISYNCDNILVTKKIIQTVANKIGCHAKYIFYHKNIPIVAPAPGMLLPGTTTPDRDILIYSLFSAMPSALTVILS